MASRFGSFHTIEQMLCFRYFMWQVDLLEEFDGFGLGIVGGVGVALRMVGLSDGAMVLGNGL